MIITKVSSQRLKSLNTRVAELTRALGLNDPAVARTVDQLRLELIRINERDRLDGVDWQGRRLTPVTYRPKGGRSPRPGAFRSRPRISARGNLTSEEYRSLTGPPLAPRRRASRVITNYVTSAQVRNGVVRIDAGWRDIVSRKGVPFLQYHVNGTPRLPKRDIAGLSLAAREMLAARITAAIREAFARG